MRTLLLSHMWMDNPDHAYHKRFRRFIEHYSDGEVWPISMMDSFSPRSGHWDYPHVWDNYWRAKEYFKDFERIFFIASDAYVCSQRLVDYMESIEDGWVTLWSPRYNMPATEIQVITPCKQFLDFFPGESDPSRYNGLCEEITLPFTHVEKGFVGDRYGEFAPGGLPYDSGMDWYGQVSDQQSFPDSDFPVVRRIDDKVVVL